MICHSEDPVAGIAVLANVLMEIKTEGALALLLLHLGGGMGIERVFVRWRRTWAEALRLSTTDRRAGAANLDVTPSYHSTSTPSTPLSVRSWRMSWDTLWAVSAEVELG